MAFEKLKQMRCWPEARAMLEEGASPEFVAEYIQKEGREYTHVQHASLARQLYRWRDVEGATPGHVFSPTFIDELIGDTKDLVNELLEISRLLKYQKKRLEYAAQTEQNIGMPFDIQGKEVSRFMAMLEKSIGIKQDLGLLARRPQQFQVQVQQIQQFEQTVDQMALEAKQALRALPVPTEEIMKEVGEEFDEVDIEELKEELRTESGESKELVITRSIDTEKD